MLDRAGLTLQDFDFYEIHEAFASQVLATLKAWESPEFCKERLGLDEPLGSIDPDRLNVNGSLAGRGAPVRRHRRAHRGDAGQAAGREGLGPRPDLDLRGRRPGRGRDPRAMSFDLRLTPAHHDLVERTHRFAAEVVRPVADEYDRREEFPWPVLEEAARQASTTRSSTAT